MTDTLRIGHGNGHNRASLTRYVRQADADSFGCNEADLLLDDLDAIRRHRVTVAGEAYAEERDPSGPRPRHRSTSIVTRNARTNLGELTVQVSERVTGHEKFAPDRILVGSFYRHPVAEAAGRDGIAHFELHPDATIMGRPAEHPLVREYAEALHSAALHMLTAQADGLIPILTGDLQAHARYRGDWGPRAILAGPLNLRARVVGIDWILTDKTLRFVGPLEVRRLHDHRGFVAELEAVRTYRARRRARK